MVNSQLMIIRDAVAYVYYVCIFNSANNCF